MKKPTEALVWEFPIHDAAIRYVRTDIALPGDSKVAVILELSLHKDEMTEQIKAELGADAELNLRFGACWRVKMDLIAIQTEPELVDSWSLVSNSPIIDELHRFDLAKGCKLYHHLLRFSGGSTLDIICEEVAIMHAGTLTEIVSSNSPSF